MVGATLHFHREEAWIDGFLETSSWGDPSRELLKENDLPLYPWTMVRVYCGWYKTT